MLGARMSQAKTHYTIQPICEAFQTVSWYGLQISSCRCTCHVLSFGRRAGGHPHRYRSSSGFTWRWLLFWCFHTSRLRVSVYSLKLPVAPLIYSIDHWEIVRHDHRSSWSPVLHPTMAACTMHVLSTCRRRSALYPSWFYGCSLDISCCFIVGNNWCGKGCTITISSLMVSIQILIFQIVQLWLWWLMWYEWHQNYMLLWGFHVWHRWLYVIYHDHQWFHLLGAWNVKVAVYITMDALWLDL
jgi:hypothetical protein